MAECLDTVEVPSETDENIGPLFDFEWDNVDTTDLDIGIRELGASDATVFTAYPGAKVPTTRGTYLVQARKGGVVRDIAYLTVTRR